MHVEWWYWIVLGFVLIGAELVVPSFTIIWFGLGAVMVGAVFALWRGFPLAGQLCLWTVASISFTVLWFKYLKPKNATGAGQAKEAIVGETGMMIQGVATPFERGTVKFPVSILGADEWRCYADTPLRTGDRVRVLDIQGQILKVAKL